MKKTTDLLPYCLIFQKYLREFYTTKLIVLWKKTGKNKWPLVKK